MKKLHFLLFLGVLFYSSTLLASANQTKLIQAFEKVYNLAKTVENEDSLGAIQEFLNEVHSTGITYKKAYVVALNEISEWEKLYSFDGRDEFSIKRQYIDENDNKLNEYFYLMANRYIAFVVIDGKVYDFHQRKEDSSKKYQPLGIKQYLQRTLLPKKTTESLRPPDVIPANQFTRQSQLERLLYSQLEIAKPQVVAYNKFNNDYYDYVEIIDSNKHSAADFLLFAGISYAEFKENLKEVDSKSKEKELRELLSQSEAGSKKIEKAIQKASLSSKDYPFIP